MALRVTVPVRPGWMSRLIRASRARANRRSWMRTLVTTTE
jgi:hypothetical protein